MRAATWREPSVCPAPPRPRLTRHPRVLLADAVFGKVIDGLDTLDALERCQVNEKHRPLSEVRLRSVTVHANPLADQMIVFPSATAAPDIQG